MLRAVCVCACKHVRVRAYVCAGVHAGVCGCVLRGRARECVCTREDVSVYMRASGTVSLGTPPAHINDAPLRTHLELLGRRLVVLFSQQFEHDLCLSGPLYHVRHRPIIFCLQFQGNRHLHVCGGGSGVCVRGGGGWLSISSTSIPISACAHEMSLSLSLSLSLALSRSLSLSHTPQAAYVE